MRDIRITPAIVALAVAAVVPVTICARQAAPDSQTRMTFEVASVKPSDPSAPPGRSFAGIASAGGRFQSANATLRGLIRALACTRDPTRKRAGLVRHGAFRHQCESGRRSASRGFPVPAQRVPVDAAVVAGGEVRVGSSSGESRQIDAYALVLARADGRLGSGLHPAIATCPPGPVQPGATNCAQSIRSGSLTMSDVELSMLALVLSSLGDRPVVYQRWMTLPARRFLRPFVNSLVSSSSRPRRPETCWSSMPRTPLWWIRRISDFSNATPTQLQVRQAGLPPDRRPGAVGGCRGRDQGRGGLTFDPSARRGTARQPQHGGEGVRGAREPGRDRNRSPARAASCGRMALRTKKKFAGGCWPTRSMRPSCRRITCK